MSTLDSDVVKDEEQLLKLTKCLQDLPSNCQDSNEELEILEWFRFRYRSERNFRQHRQEYLRGTSCFDDVLSALIKRLKLWMTYFSLLNNAASQQENVLQVLTCLKILLRDPAYQELFANHDGIKVLTEHLLKTTNGCMLLRSESTFTIDVLREITNIYEKLSCSDHRRDLIVDCDAPRPLIMLLSTDDIVVLKNTLHVLINLSQSYRARKSIAELNSVEIILRILQDYDINCKKVSAQLLRILLDETEVKEMVKVYDGIPILLSLLHTDSIKLLWNIVWCLVLLASDVEMSQDIRTMGGIPLLLSMLHDKKFKPRSDTLQTKDPIAEGVDTARERYLSLKSACCACLTELVTNDSNGHQAVQNNAIYLLSLLILPDGTSLHNRDADVNLQAYAFRALRFLFSMERNRRHFKRLFPAELFEKFIDIGHYNRSISAYMVLVNDINSLSEEDLDEIRENVESTNQNRAPSKYIGDYAILELLGSGAFGVVYKVQKKSVAQSYFAMKEINDTGKTTKEKQKNLKELYSELSIIQEKLKHPNIVRYYKTFICDDKLYIVMELIEGASLEEHFTSIKEKNGKFSEERVWNIFFQMVLALRYLHKEKSIVHRDLTPNNIMLGERDKVTITDFGLAKQKRPDCSKMNSVVGTILYSCPEIVQNEDYGEKADVWALGCILYQMCALHPPFYSNNMLALVGKIVKADYDPLPDGAFSSRILSTVKLCLTSDPECRPDIVGIAAHIADLLLIHTDDIRKEQSHLRKKLEREQRRTQKHFYHEYCSTNQYHEMMRSSDFQKKQPSLTGSAGSADMKSEMFFNGDFGESGNTCVSLAQRQESILTPSETGNSDLDSDEDAYGTTDITGSKPLSKKSSHVVPRPPEGTPRKCRKPRSLEKSFQNLTITTGKPAVCDSLPSSYSSPSLRVNVTPLSVSPSALPLSLMQNSPSPLSSGSAAMSECASPCLGSPTVESPFEPPARRPCSFTLGQERLDKLVRRTATAGKSRPNSATAALTISPRKVRPVQTDPILQVLEQLHRILFINQLPPSLYVNPRRRAVDCFKRALFGPHSSAINLKNELHKLVTGSRKFIDLNIGMTDFTSKLAQQVSQEHEAMTSNSNSSKPGLLYEFDQEAGITYEQMRSIIDSLLLESNYDERCNGASNKHLHHQPVHRKP